MLIRASVLAVLATGVISASALAQQTWRVSEGETTFQLPRQLLNDIGIRLQSVQETATPRSDHEEPLGFRVVAKSNLMFGVEQWAYRGWTQGQVDHEGGFVLAGPRGSVDMRGFRITFRQSDGTRKLVVTSGPKSGYIDVFTLEHVKVNFNRPDETIVFGFADAVLSGVAASKLGVNRYAGQVLGMITVSTRASFVNGDPNDSPPMSGEGGGGVNGDVQLFQLGDCSQYGRFGSYPNGYTGIGMSTTSCNVTTLTQDNVDWYQQMDERHPIIPQNFYRVRPVTGAGTRFEQLGLGWVKHGFLSLNDNQCGTCQQPPGGGNQLGRNCSDTYSSSLNASRSWLGPRNEIDANTGWWECTGSYFSNYVNDCTSRFSTSGVGPTQYRLTIADADLVGNPANTKYIYEAWYVSHDDIDRYNNAAWRYCTPSWTGSTWTFSGQNPQYAGVAVDRWYDATGNTLAPRAQPQSEGDVIVALQATDMGGGMWHYEYAVYNYTCTRGIRSFSLPVGEEVQISNVEFRDVDHFYNTGITATASNTATLTVKNARYLKVGDTVLISQGASAPVNRTIQSVNSTTSITLSAAVTASTSDSVLVSQAASNDWTYSRSGCALNWETSTYAQDPNANAMVWGKVFNFRFDANVAPVATTSTLGVFAPGTVTQLTAATSGPGKPTVKPTSFAYTGGLLSGSLSDLFCNENSKLILRPGAVAIATLPPATLTVDATYAGTAPVTSLKVRVESSASVANIVQRLFLKNFNNAGAFEEVDVRTLTIGDGLIEINVANPANYVEDGTKAIVAKLTFKNDGATPVFPWQARTDQFVFIVN